MLAGVIALDERNLGAVRTPLDRFRSAACDPALGEDLFNRELLRSGGLGMPGGKQNQQLMVKTKRSFFTNALRCSMRC